jgi:hypothetical protein
MHPSFWGFISGKVENRVIFAGSEISGFAFIE